MYFELETRDVDTWFAIGGGEFCSAQRAIDRAREDFDIPIENLRVKAVTKEKAFEDTVKCETCGGNMVRQKGEAVCDLCGRPL